ncbi:MAG: hypothetical protein ACT4NY_09170 [Pseudonocardiales bacterium]
MTAHTRRECAYCGAAGRWPDRCPGEPADPECVEIIAMICGFGDHRRCIPEDCDVAHRWHAQVKHAGRATAQAEGRAYAVVSIIDDRLYVVGTNDHLGRAKSLLRSGYAKRNGYPELGPASKGVVYVVRDDGALL